MSVQARTRLLAHGHKLNAHSPAKLAVAHPRAGAYIAARNFEDKFYEISRRRRLWRRDEQAAKA